MQLFEINNRHNKIIAYVIANRLNEAFSELALLTKDARVDFLIDQCILLEENYKSILDHSFTEIKDPEKDKMIAGLQHSIIELADTAKDATMKANGMFMLSSHEKETLIAQIEEAFFHDNLSDLLRGSAIVSDNVEQEMDFEDIAEKLFTFVHHSAKINQDEALFLEKIYAHPKFPVHYKAMCIGALMLSLQRCFDIQKIWVLLDLIEQKEHEIWQRAFTALIVSLYQYDKRLDFYPEISQRMKILLDDRDMEDNLEILLLQLIRSKDAERVNQKVSDEILPEVSKLKNNIIDKLQMDDIMSEIEEGRNPDWENLLEESPGLYSKLEELSKLQMEGADVFLHAFTMLKNFDFFKKLPNWFVPFYPGNHIAQEAFQSENNADADKFTNGLAKTPFICNSDKYSFCLNMNRMPDAQKKMMKELFLMELNEMNDLNKEDEKINAGLKNKTIFQQFTQDSYRFYTLFDNKAMFFNVFSTKLNFHEKKVLSFTSRQTNISKTIANYYFENDLFENAIEIYTQLTEKNKEIEIIEKTAYGYQKIKNYEKAIECYHIAELNDKGKLWTLKNLMYCYRQLQQFEKSIEYGLELEKLTPDDIYIHAILGNNYTDAKQYEAALKHYYKVEYLTPDNQKNQRPLAWCSFMLNKFDIAEKYYAKIIDSKKAKWFDYLNLAHVNWCNRKINNAINNYTFALKYAGDTELFRKTFHQDIPILIEKEKSLQDIHLMFDQIKYKCNTTSSL